jgi:pimeloyl-ACP methyl ester carboxylesterase
MPPGSKSAIREVWEFLGDTVRAVIETDVKLGDVRTVHVYDAGADRSDDRLPVFWQHGTSNVGAPPKPLFPDAERLRLRWVSHDRPGYGGSTPNPGRDVASVAADVAGVADALGIDRFTVMGHSGGGPHALACAALLPERVLAVVSVAGPAPYDSEGLDFFAGMADAGVASLSAAAEGRESRERYEASGAADDFGFTPADEAALANEWSWLIEVVRAALAGGPGGMIDDDLAAVAPWGFDPNQVRAPVLLLHGDSDRVVPSSHSRWLADRLPAAELRILPEGHITVLNSGAAALGWLREQADRGSGTLIRE